MRRESHEIHHDNDRDTLFMLSGIALMVFRSVLILSSSVAR